MTRTLWSVFVPVAALVTAIILVGHLSTATPARAAGGANDYCNPTGQFYNGLQYGHNEIGYSTVLNCADVAAHIRGTTCLQIWSYGFEWLGVAATCVTKDTYSAQINDKDFQCARVSNLAIYTYRVEAHWGVTFTEAGWSTTYDWIGDSHATRCQL